MGETEGGEEEVTDRVFTVPSIEASRYSSLVLRLNPTNPDGQTARTAALARNRLSAREFASGSRQSVQYSQGRHT